MKDESKTLSERKGYFKGAVKNLRSVKAIAIAGMLLALHLVLSLFLGVYLTQSVKFSVSFITNVITAYLFGPWMALITGALGDILQYVLKPVGPYFFGWTFNAAIGGLLYGLFLYRKAPKEINALQEGGAGKINRINLVSASAAFIVTVAGWFAMPFLQVVTKVTEAEPERRVLSEGSAFEFARLWFQGVNDKGAGLIAFAMAVLLIVVYVLFLLRRHMPALAVSVIALLWLLLPVYTDRKEMLAQSGFVLLAVGFAVFMLLALLQILWKRSVDGMYLLRCFIVMALKAVVVQMFLGTVWCSVMYGKGFWFYFVPRAIKSLIEVPFDTVLVYYTIALIKKVRIGAE